MTTPSPRRSPPLAYTEMIMTTVLGYIFFGDLPDRDTLLGVAILIACALYISLSQQPAPVAAEQP